MGCIDCKNSRVSPEHTNIESPENVEYIVQKRTCTDVAFLCIMITSIIILIALVSYCISFGDIFRIVNGYDDCGNVCGRKNIKYESLGCSGVDHTNAKYLLVHLLSATENPSLVHRTCTSSCGNEAEFLTFLNRCLPIKQSEKQTNGISFFSKTGIQNFFEEVSEDLEICWQQILYLCFFAFVISLIFVLALRLIVGIIVWIVLIGIVSAFFSGTVFLWVRYKQLTDESYGETISEERKQWCLIFAIAITIATICISLIILALRNRICLVIQLFKEAGKAITNMPLLLFEPILTFVALLIFGSFWIYLAVSIESSGEGVVENNQSIRYVKDSTMMFTRWYNLFSLFWLSNFVICCQHMVIAGAVASWFFTRNKTKLTLPIATSFRNLVFYHLGTVAKGSLLLACTNLLRIFLKKIYQQLKYPKHPASQFCSTTCQCCLCIFEKFLKFINRNAFIETAIAGQPFCTSARKAFNLLSNNALRILTINSIGDFVLILTKAFIVLSTILVGIELVQRKEGVYHSWVIVAIVGLFAYFIAHGFISVYEITIDTIFICFCEDCEQNDGINQQYFMSRGLMEYIQNSKRVLHVNEEYNSKAWRENT